MTPDKINRRFTRDFLVVRLPERCKISPGLVAGTFLQHLGDLGILEVGATQPLFVDDDWEAAVRTRKAAAVSSGLGNLVRMTPVVTQLGALPANDKQTRTGAHRRPPFSRARVALGHA